MLKHKDTVIFDLDGVIIDSEYRYLLRQLDVIINDGLEISEEQLYPLVGLEWEKHFDLISKLYENVKSPSELRHDYELYYKNSEISYKDWIFKDVRSSLKKLKSEGFSIALASNSEYRIIVNVLNQLRLHGYFDIIVSAESFEEGKPNPEIYEYIVKKLNKPRKDILVIEDSKSGIQAAKKAGLFVAAIKDKRFNQDQSQADIIIEKISDIFV